MEVVNMKVSILASTNPGYKLTKDEALKVLNVVLL